MKSQTKNRSLWCRTVLFSIFFVFLSLTAEAQTTGSITGRVLDSSDNPVAGMRVDVCAADNINDWKTSSIKKTDSNGDYTLPDLMPGNYKVRYSAHTIPTLGLVTEWYDDKPDFTNATVLTVRAGETTSLNNTVLSAGGSISGTVTDSSGSVSISGVYVYMYKITFENGTFVPTWVITATTDERGAYKADGLPLGYSYTIYFGAFNTEYMSKWHSETVYVNDVAGKTINVQLYKGGKISGTVTSYNAAGEQVPVVNAWVDVYNRYLGSDGQPVWIGYARTDATGFYAATGLPTGTFKVQFFEKYSNGSKSGLTEWYDNKSDFSAAISVSVAGTETTANINAVLGYNKAYNKTDSSAILPVYKLLLLKPSL